MPKCRNCKCCVGYDVISGCYICDATEEMDYIDPDWADDDDLGCDLYVYNSDDDTTA